MRIDIGEQIVGAYLKIIERCDVVSYNVRPPGGGLLGLNELDVIGLRFADKTAFVCEVVTHIRGTLYGSGNTGTVTKIVAKHERQKSYAEAHLNDFPAPRYMLWSPRVPVGAITQMLSAYPELELIINSAYKEKVEALRSEARKRTNDEGNDAFRMLQILECLR
jgi:hypothetical protein